MKMKNMYKTFLKGFLMGLCDLIPGISGGTIAFITGIYERLINAIKGFSPTLFYSLLVCIFAGKNKKEFRENLKKTDLAFLIPLLVGILAAIAVFSRAMSFLLDNYPSFVMAFFVGLILASAKTIFNHIERHHSLNILFSVFGLAIGVALAFVVPANVNPTMAYVFLGGFLAISAMILPGISGSFILLLLGIYGFMLNLINNLPNNFEYLLIFVLGLLFGLFMISRVVSFLFRKDKSKTLYVLLGLVVGGLSVPLKEITRSLVYSAPNILIHIVLFISGVLAASLVANLAKK